SAPSLTPVLPEIVLALSALALLMVGNFRLVLRLSVLALIAVGVMVFGYAGAPPASTFGGMVAVDGFSTFMKLLVVAGSALALTMSAGYLEREKIARAEYPVLALF